MRIQIPPHVAWPAFIVALLLLSVGTSVGTLVIAGTDGGAQIVDDYYQQGVRWDETAARRAASEALGWTVEVVVQPTGLQEGLRTVDVVVRDRAGQGVDGLQGMLRASRPQHAAAVAALPLQPVPGEAGLYRQQMPVAARGIWDFNVEATRDTLVFVETVRVEVGS